MLWATILPNKKKHIYVNIIYSNVLTKLETRPEKSVQKILRRTRKGLQEREKERREREGRNARSIGHPLKNHTLYMHRRPFRGIFSASLVPFDERIPRWMPENIRERKKKKKKKKIAFVVNSSGIAPLDRRYFQCRRLSGNNEQTNCSSISLSRALSLYDITRHAAGSRR